MKSLGTEAQMSTDGVFTPGGVAACGREFVVVLGARTTAVPVVLLLVGAKTDAGEGTISAVEWMGLDRVRRRPSPPMKLPLLLLLYIRVPPTARAQCDR